MKSNKHSLTGGESQIEKNFAESFLLKFKRQCYNP